MYLIDVLFTGGGRERSAKWQERIQARGRLGGAQLLRVVGRGRVRAPASRVLVPPPSLRQINLLMHKVTATLNRRMPCNFFKYKSVF